MTLRDKINNYMLERQSLPKKRIRTLIQVKRLKKCITNATGPTQKNKFHT